MGEIDDPTQRFIHSTVKLANYVEDVKFFNDSFEEGAGIYFRETSEGPFSAVSRPIVAGPDISLLNTHSAKECF